MHNCMCYTHLATPMHCSVTRKFMFVKLVKLNNYRFTNMFVNGR